MKPQKRTELLHSLRKGLMQGAGLALGLTVTTLVAVPLVGTINTFTSGTTLSSADMNQNFVTITDTLAAIPNWTLSGSDAVYTAGNVGIGAAPAGAYLLHVTTGSNNSTPMRVQNTSGGGIQTFIDGAGNGRFQTLDFSGTQRIILDSATQEVRINGNTQMEMDAANHTIGTTSNHNLRLQSNGIIRIEIDANTTGNATFYTIAGDCTIMVGPGISCTSDERMKRDIQPAEANLDKLERLDPVTYKWKKGDYYDRTYLGFTAQNVESVFPELVITNEKTGYKQLSLTGLTVPLVGSVQELSEKEKLLRRKLSLLEAQKESLEYRLAQQERRLLQIEGLIRELSAAEGR